MINVDAAITYLHFPVLGIEVMAEAFFAVIPTTAFANDLTEVDPPAHVHDVDQTRAALLSEVTVVHCEPDVAADSPHTMSLDILCMYQ
jgi:hypothetical protein